MIILKKCLKELEILHNAGKVSAKVAQELAYKEYDKYKNKIKYINQILINS